MKYSRIIYVLQTSSNYNSDAAYNRVRLFKEGLDEIKVDCEIIRLELPDKFNAIGIFQYILSGISSLCSLFYRISKKDIVIIYGETYFSFLYRFLALKSRLAFERTEFPAFELNKNLTFMSKHNSKANLNAMKCSNMLITCSHTLEKYYSSKHNFNSIILPLIININEFNRPEYQSDNCRECISYCGTMNNNKDGVPVLIQSFASISKKLKDYKLLLIGPASKETLSKLREQIRTLGIEEQVEITGKINHDEVISKLSNSKVLALARPANLQAEGGIPSKVGEYLATGVPCVVTKVGEIVNYLRDGENCFLAEPDSVDSFSEKLIESINSDKRGMVSINAKNTANMFSHTFVAKQLVSFINDN